ncbi:protein-tyrosine phosphatase family protein [Frigoriglobus tundricola]|uniref:Tyrosine specific protein phosphatases domain-containing protein n=1 Tax=Frigoriglobus tundricola TaxID=2774151 RepID=A0A6M5YVZ5_9BACT|nr:protein phosphatase [Frigoriglobus tundricola]QJW98215.1 hypothetical protein FTUN_5796 [Frigoriglobus tundricola]
MRHIDRRALWIGTARDARDMRAVLDAGIEAVVDLAKMCEPVQPTRELVYLRYPLVDGAGNPPWLIGTAAHAVADLLRRGVPTLVACDGGMSRSVVIAAIAVWHDAPDVSPDEHLRRIAANGPADVQPTLWAEVKQHACSASGAGYQRSE